MKALIKIGGTLIDSAESRDRLAREIATVRDNGIEIAVVHGGGRQMTRFLAERGIESHFVNGLRVTSPEVLDAVVKVLAGTVNQELVAAFVRAGSKPVGLTGLDAILTEAEQLSPELGFVGRPVCADAALLTLLAQNGYLPVIACMAGDRSGNVYNVNADQMAVACASAWAADMLLFLTDVAGVCGADSEIIPSLDSENCDRLIRDGIATGGMQAKLEAAKLGVGNGIGAVTIAPGAEPGIVTRSFAGEVVGTRIVQAGRGAPVGA